jgi:hypothetical protein
MALDTVSVSERERSISWPARPGSRARVVRAARALRTRRGAPCGPCGVTAPAAAAPRHDRHGDGRSLTSGSSARILEPARDDARKLGAALSLPSAIGRARGQSRSAARNSSGRTACSQATRSGGRCPMFEAFVRFFDAKGRVRVPRGRHARLPRSGCGAWSTPPAAASLPPRTLPAPLLWGGASRRS